MNINGALRSVVDSERRHEMRRGGQACESCRAGKRKCDGARPVCGTCAKRGPRANCEYEKHGGRKTRTTKQIELLEQRIAELEENRPKAAESESHQGSPLHSQPFVESLPDFPSHGPPTEALFPSLLSPHLVNLTAGGDVAFAQDAPDARTSSNDNNFVHQRQYTFTSHLDEEPKLVGGCVDGMGVVASDGTDTSNLCAEQIGYFGMSSTVNFVNQVHRILIESKGGPRGCSVHRQTEANGTMRRELQTPYSVDNHTPSRSFSDEYVVPMRREADAMLEIFWLQVHPLYPILDRERFEKDYAGIWTTDGCSSTASSGTAFAGSPDYRHQYPTHLGYGKKIPKSRSFHMLLNVMFALGCQCDPSEPSYRQAQRGEVFWRRTKDLLELDFDVFNQPCIEFILAFFFMSVYLQSTTQLTGACWNLVGVAIRFAQALGLHCNSHSSIKKFTEGGNASSGIDIYNSLRWRTWAGLVLMDRTLATTYGRPPMISSSRSARIRLPAELARQASLSSPSSSPSSTSLLFLIHLLKLQEILADVVTHFNDDESATADESGDALPQYSYGGEESNMIKAPFLIRQVDTGEFQDLMSFETNLINWEKDLPTSLRLPPTLDLINNPQLASSVQRQSAALRARYLYGQVLIFRPLLLYQMARSKYRSGDLCNTKTISSTLGSALLERCLTICINAASELVLLLDWLNRNRRDALPESWYTIFYLYTCGMVLLVHRHCAVGVGDANHAWSKCLDVLSSYETRSRTALRCLKLLQLSNSSFLAHKPPSIPEPLTNRPMDDAAPPPVDQLWSGDGSSFTPGGIGEDVAIYGERLQSHEDHFAGSWMNEQIDLAWLNSVPFELSVEDWPDISL